ncbi:MAG: hypothetical protein IPI67_21935 [Myxococcales bacterium]|nr:hypothetical protein [Myxococcales bacterium]
MTLRGWTLLGLCCALPLATQGCDDGAYAGDDGLGGSGGGGGAPITGAGVGQECSGIKPCRQGLACKNGLCELGHSTLEGQICVIAGECADGLQCITSKCAKAGSGTNGDGCTSDADCESGLRCVLAGFSTQCAPEGTGDVGALCTTSGDCYGGLTCTLGKCNQPLPGAPTFGLPTWQGVACDAASAGSVRAYFEVPGVKAPKGQEADFFRLPFPNDVRIKGGWLDLYGFPTPGPELLGFDPVKGYIDALEKNESAWGTSPTVIFRFSGEIDFDSFSTEAAGKYPVQWVDITTGTPEYGSSAGLFWAWNPNKTHYVCENNLSVRRPTGAPMTPGHQYAVYLTTAGKAKSGVGIDRSEHLTAVLADAAPADGELALAHAAFKPFRDYLKDKLIDSALVLNASVITAGKVREPMKQLATAVLSAGVPAAKGWVKCGGGAKSPCPQADGDRACGDGASPDFDEYHALLSLPVFQKGTPPYTDAGGDLRFDQPERSEDVCMALTVPKGAMPAAGWPLTVFAHGTGGSFRSHVRPEIAGALSKAKTPAGSVGFAVLGIDQAEHGPRRGASSASPNDLFYNFKNPAAARGNPLQGGVDQLALARFASTLNVDAATSKGADIKVDPNAIVFYGHSQGSTAGSLALPYTDVYKGSVLSGNGASLIHALLAKKQPVNIAGALPFVLADMDSSGKLNGGDMHPVLTLLQIWIDPADPLNHARAIGTQPETGSLPKHVFQTYGTGDNYSPGTTMAAFALAGGFDLGTHDASATKPEPIGDPGLAEKALPLAGNKTVAGAKVTLVVREYGPPSGKDGHFVALDVANATSDITRFLGMVAEGAVPQVGP